MERQATLANSINLCHANGIIAAPQDGRLFVYKTWHSAGEVWQIGSLPLRQKRQKEYDIV